MSKLNMLEYSLSPISSSSALQAAMTAISSHLRSNFNIMPSTVYLTKYTQKRFGCGIWHGDVHRHMFSASWKRVSYLTDPYDVVSAHLAIFLRIDFNRLLRIWNQAAKGACIAIAVTGCRLRAETEVTATRTSTYTAT